MHNLEVESTDLADSLDTMGNVQEGMNTVQESLGKMVPITEIWKNLGGTHFEGILNILFRHVKFEILMRHPRRDMRATKYTRPEFQRVVCHGDINLQVIKQTKGT